MKQIEVGKRILADNQAAADLLRSEFINTRTLVLNLISSPGSGKTTLLENTVGILSSRHQLAVIEGDIATERDAERLRKLGVPARQIITGGSCHLDARQIRDVLSIADFGILDILFIENVGNLVCPTTYDLGEDYKVALLSVTEGDDKPFKYPGIFARAAATLITKTDLLDYVSFDMDAVMKQIFTLNPDSELMLTSAKTGTGIQEWCDWISRQVDKKQKNIPII